MRIPILLVNYKEEDQKLYFPLLMSNGFSPHSASSMQEALIMLVDREFACVVINGDHFEYIPLLKVMRKITKAPLCVSVSHYQQDENKNAVINGADIFRVRYDEAENRVERFSDFVKIYLEFVSGQQQPMTVLEHGELQVFPSTRRAYVKGIDARLLPKEFDILHYLMQNKGISLSYNQIFRRVWGDDYSDNARSLLWSHICRLRSKLRTAPGLPDYITTIRNYGYSFVSE